MTTNFTSLPIIDLAALSRGSSSAEPLPDAADDLAALARQLHDVFETVGFAYLVNCPLSFTHDEVFGLARAFFDLPREEKMSVAKKTFRPGNRNTYRGYFPAQEGANNLKEGFEMGPPSGVPPSAAEDGQASSPFALTEENVFPASPGFESARGRLETLHAELQSLATTLLRLLTTSVVAAAGSAGQKPAAADLLVDRLLINSVSTLRLLHYPPAPPSRREEEAGQRQQEGEEEEEQELCCTPHTDSGLLTLLHQDATGGLEVRNAAGAWVPAPYVPGSLVVNIGDLLAEISGHRLVATRHRVRRCNSSSNKGKKEEGGRYSVPFFFEPGVDAMVGGCEGKGEKVRYGDFVLGKMRTWIEFQDVKEEEERDDGEREGTVAGIGLGGHQHEVDVGA